MLLNEESRIKFAGKVSTDLDEKEPSWSNIKKAIEKASKSDTESIHSRKKKP